MSLSSTALALKILAEKKHLTSQHGRASFAILLFQDLAAIPLLAVLPLLDGSMSQGWDWFGAVKVVVMVCAVIVAGQLGCQTVFRRPVLSPQTEQHSDDSLHCLE